MMDQRQQTARDLAVDRLEEFMEEVRKGPGWGWKAEQVGGIIKTTKVPGWRWEAERIVDAIIEAATPVLSEHTRTIEAFRAGVEAIESIEEVGEPKKD